MTRSHATPYLLLLPGLGLAVAILAYPLFQVVEMSTSTVTRFGAVRGWNALANFAAVYADPLFWTALRNTLLWTGTVVGGTVAVAFPVALLLNQGFAGQSAARVLVMLPWSVSLSMTAIVWLWAFDGEIGLVNKALTDLGLHAAHLQWLSDPNRAFAVVIVVGILVSVPFTVTVLLGGLSSVPGDLYEAASTEGASAVQRLTRVTLPLMRPFLSIVLVLNVINVFNSFPIIWIMTAGGPYDQTHILVTYLYQLAFRLGRLGEASAISLVMLAILLAFTAVYVRLVSRGDGDA